MVIAKDLLGAGFSAGQASALGGQFASPAATGSTQTDAAPLTASNNTVSGADGTKGVILTGQVGDSQLVVNTVAATLKVYPTSGAAVFTPGSGDGSANAAYSQTSQAVCLYVRTSATRWVVCRL